MARKNSRRPRPARSLELTIKNPNAAGIDVGATFHTVAVPPDRDAESVRTFNVYTPDLYELAKWLLDCRVTTVGLEATGVYWIPIYEILMAKGIDVVVVNPTFVRRTRDPETDACDSQLLLQLHTFGQLPASFRPNLDISTVQCYWRQRGHCVDEASDAIRRMQKVLDLMSLHLHKAISDLSGVTGLRIVRAIVGGTHDPETLASMKEPGIKCSHEELVAALTGNYGAAHLFILAQDLAEYDFRQRQIQECDAAIFGFTSSLPDGPKAPDPPKSDSEDQPKAKKRRSGHRGNQPKSFSLEKELERLTGRDWSVVPALGPMTIMTAIAEVGLDLSLWPTERHFSSWLSLCPDPKITGGRTKSSHTRKNKNRFATALRIAASTLRRSKSALGAEFRRLCARLGKAQAITAMAHRLACLFYRIMRYGQAYVEIGQDAYEAKTRENTIRYLKSRARGGLKKSSLPSRNRKEYYAACRISMLWNQRILRQRPKRHRGPFSTRTSCYRSDRSDRTASTYASGRSATRSSRTHCSRSYTLGSVAHRSRPRCSCVCCS